MNPIEQEEITFTKTVKSLFEVKEAIRIPAYQRAYSWEHDKQCTQFLEDLKEQSGKRYYLGQFLFEKDAHNNILFVVDGQQRLTTSVIFLSVIAKLLNEQGKPVNEIREIYLNDKFRTIDDDQGIFKKYTQKHLIASTDDTETLSQRRITKAFIFFELELSKIPLSELEQLKETLEHAVVSTFFISNKTEAAQIFEYQNNRGKDLSRFEIIKAFLMHQIHVQSESNTQANLEILDIQGVISRIYRNVEAVEGFFTENELLDNCCDLFYGLSGNIDLIKERIKKEDSKVEWIKLFFENFEAITHSSKSIIKNKHLPEIANLFFVGNEVNWKMVLLTIFCKGDADGSTYKKILKLLEILCFKFKLGNFRTDYLSRYSKIYYNNAVSESLELLYQEIKQVTENGFKWYWNQEGQFKNIISNYFENQTYHYNQSVIKFVLWQYENAQRVSARSGALLDKNLYDDYTIEHIVPQNPEKKKYSQKFEEKYLHKAGNLALLTKSQNSQFSNKSFTQKHSLFQNTALCSYTEIRSKEKWAELEIDERHLNIVRFVKEYLDTSNL